MPELKAILIVILLILPSIQLFSNFEESGMDSNIAKLLNNNNSQIIPDDVTLGTTRSARSMTEFEENNAHGGSWVDSFKDDSGIEYNYNVFYQNNDITLRKYTYLLNGEAFEKGTVGQIPENWTYHTYFYGTGTGYYSEQLNLIDTSYFSGSKALYAYLRGDERTGGYRPHLNITPVQPFINLSGARYVYVHMRDIQDYHSIGWGWIVGILVQFYDGVNKYKTQLYYYGESNPRSNKFNYTMKGADGNTWYGYMRKIPENINTSNLNFTIFLIANDWTSNSYYCWISTIIDKIYFVNDPKGVIKSKPINVPENMQWDTLIINKTQPKNCVVDITILNASNNQPIPGIPKYSNEGEIDISSIDPVKYPSIKLKAELVRNQTKVPALHYWGVSWKADNAWRDTLFGNEKGISRNLTTGDGELWLNTSITNWYKYSNNPILKPGPGSSWDNNMVATPSVIYNGSGYLMYYRGGNTIRGIGIATSSDSITWTKYPGNPVLSPTASAWDSFAVSNPNVIYDGELYKMWFTGQDSASDRRIGYATSTDGFNWIKHSNNPVLDLGSTGKWDSHYAQNPFVIFENELYKMWYIGLGTPTYYQLGYATSTDGINWTKHPNNPIMQSSIGYYDGILNMFVIPTEYNYLGWYELGDGTGNNIREIYHATSNDGIRWVNYTYNPVLKKGASGSWDDVFVGHANIHYIKKQYYMYYYGNSGSSMQIGLAKSKFDTYGKLTSNTI
ncbi:hypothetical protein, partial [[Eubacterium] cellulosolvens]